MKEVRILIADDHEIVREGLKAVLSAKEGWVICAEAFDGRDAVAKALQVKPNVAILDFAMPEMNGLEAARQIRRELPQTEVLMLTMHNSDRLAHEALEAGAKGFILKSDAKRHLVAAVEALSTGRPFLTGDVSSLLLSHYLAPAEALKGDPGTDRLTSREREIIQLIAEGNTTKEIATRLSVSDKTIDTHRSNVLRKLNLRSAVDLVRYAVRNNIIQP